LPTNWDDVKFIDGFPGQYVVLARKSGNKWYLAGINGTGEEKSLSINLNSFKGKKATIYSNSKGNTFIDQKNISVQPGKKETLIMGAHDGFVIVLE
jgi:alpha-glucosidase